MAHQRMSTIAIGCTLCFAINVIVFPVWAGDDLHNSILRNMEGLAESLEGKLQQEPTIKWMPIISMYIEA